MSTKHNIGLFGFGHVGQGIHDIVKENSTLKNFTYENIVVKNADKQRPEATAPISANAEDVWNNEKVNLIVEAVSTSEDGLDIANKAFELKKDLVTANKKMIAENFLELKNKADEAGVNYLYEASVAGSIPVIRTIEDYYEHENIDQICGILNGSSNYILTSILKNKETFEEALQKAKDLGFAEIDPTLDISGGDALNKLVILTVHAFGVITHPTDIFTYGIETLSPESIELAKLKGAVVKQIALAKRTPNGLTLSVTPALIKSDSPLFHIDYEFNAIELTSKNADVQLLKGRGAGNRPTGNAIASDLKAIENGYHYRYNKLKNNNNLVHNKYVELDVYIGLANTQKLPAGIDNVVNVENIGERVFHRVKITDLQLSKLKSELLAAKAEVILNL